MESRQATWAYFSASEIIRLHQSLTAYGVSDFKLVAAVLCVGSASIAKQNAESSQEVPIAKLLEVSLDPLNANEASMVEIHLAEGMVETKDDPFKLFFEKPENDKAFYDAILGNDKVAPELDELQQDDYRPSGYRERLENSCSFLNLDGLNFTCNCCKASFSSRNRLFVHIRSSSECMKSIAESDSMGFHTLQEVMPHIYALTFGSHDAMPWGDLKMKLLDSLACVGDHIEFIRHEEQERFFQSRELLCPSVALMILVRMSCGLQGEALQSRLKDSDRMGEALSIHGCVPVSKALAYDWPTSSVVHHFAYLLPFEALSQDDLKDDFAERQLRYRAFKQALNRVQKMKQTTNLGEDLQMKMTERWA